MSPPTVYNYVVTETMKVAFLSQFVARVSFRKHHFHFVSRNCQKRNSVCRVKQFHSFRRETRETALSDGFFRHIGAHFHPYDTNCCICPCLWVHQLIALIHRCLHSNFQVTNIRLRCVCSFLQGRSQEFDLGGYKWICAGSRRQNNHI